MSQKDNSHIDYQTINESEEFQSYKRKKYVFVFTIPILFLFYYLAFIMMSAYMKPLMTKLVFGNFTFGYLFGASYFVVVWILAFVYVAVAKKNDKKVDEIVSKYGPEEEKGA